jgi:membrane associated rhomboid family serine protease
MPSPSAESPPNTNPVQSAYESFARETPLVTRYCITAFVLSYVTSFIFDFTSALVNIPLLTVFRFEIYRIILAPFISENILTLIFACIAFSTYGKMIEFNKGSTVFGALILMIGLLSNLTFLLICLLLYFIQNEMTWLVLKSSGPFTIIPGLMAFECALAPAESKRRLFMCEIPTVYYAAVLTVLWYLFSGDNFTLFLSMGVGYLFGFRRLRYLWPSLSRRKSWENSWLRNFTVRPGWVVGSNEDDDRWLPLHSQQVSVPFAFRLSFKCP